MMKVLAIAMLCHAANAAYCSSIGDNSQVPWDQAPDWQKESAKKGVEFCLANPDAPPSANHDSWMAEKVADGWVYGEVKDPEAKPPTHPCIVPFDKLPAEQQFKDVLFKTIVAGCAADLDTGIDDMSGLDPDFVAGLETTNSTLNDQIATLTDQLADRQKTVEALSTDNDALKAKLVDAEKQVKSAKASVTRAATPAAPRKLKTMDSGLSGDDLTDALAKADADEKLVEIAFSDGSKEIAGIPPIVITGEVWRDHTRGKMLRDPVKVDGPSTGGSSVAIDGYALLIDGKQVAYCQRSEPVRVNAGQAISLQDDIWF